MEAIAESYLKLGFVGLVIVVFLYLYLCYAKNTNKTLTDINKKIFEMFTNEVKSLAEDSHENKRLNKDTAVIQAQMQKVLLEHDKYSRESWERITKLLNEMCELLNGGNPAIKLIQQEINDMRKKFK